MKRFATAFCGAACLAAASVLAPSGEARASQVKIDAELGQGAVVASHGKRIYLRISLEGLGGESRRIPVNLGIVVDRSGSMQDENKIGKAREGAVMALGRLGESDIGSVVAFNHDVDVLLPARHVSDHEAVNRAIERLEADGNTALYAGTEEGIRQVSKYLDKDYVNRLILISDGIANVGPSSPDEVAELGRKAARKGIAITTIGLGLGYNEDLMTRLAYASDGSHAFVERSEDLVEILNKELGDVLSVVAQDIIIRIDCHGGFKPTRVIGREAEIRDGEVVLHLNQLYGKQQKYAVLELDVPEGAKAGDLSVADVEVTYTGVGGGSRATEKAHVSARITDRAEDEQASLNKDVMGDISTQLANEVHEKAVQLRDKGDVDAAKQLLEGYASDLDSQAATGIAPAAPMAQQFRNDAESLASDQNWNRTRKAMKAYEYKNSTQQSY